MSRSPQLRKASVRAGLCIAVLSLFLAGSLASNADRAAAVPTHPTQTIIVCDEPATVGFLTLCAISVEDVLDPELGSRTAPTGTVSFESNSPGIFKNLQGGQVGSCALEKKSQVRSGCQFSYTPTQLVTGTHELSADYGADAVHKTSSDDFLLHIKHTTSQQVSCAPIFQRTKSISCSVTIEDLATNGGKVTPTGNTNLSSGLVGGVGTTTEGISTPSCPLSPGSTTGKAVCNFTYTPVPKDEHREERFVSSEYLETPPHETSVGGFIFTVPAVTHTTVDCTPPVVVLGGAATCTIKVEAPTGESPEALSVTLAASLPGTFPSGFSCNLPPTTTRTASCNVSFKPSVSGNGHLILTANYPGGIKDEESQGKTEIGLARETTTSVECVPADIAPGAGSQCVVTVEDLFGGNPTEAEPIESVAFTSNNQGTFAPAPKCVLSPANFSAPLNHHLSAAGNKASCAVTYLPGKTGDHSVTAAYQGDGVHLPSQGNAQILAHRHTTAQVACAPPRVDTGSLTSCTVTVTDDSPAAIQPTGRVDFFHEGVGNFEGNSFCQLSPGGPANASTCTVGYRPTKIGNGSHSITAFYNGIVGVDSSQGSTLLEVGNPTKTSLACVPTTVAVTTPTICTATVVDESVEVRQVTGNVAFTHTSTGQFSGSGECQLVPIGPGNSSCTLTYTPAAAGDHTLKAAYTGEASHSSSEDSKTISSTVADTGTSVSCTPSSLIISQSTQCTAKVSDSVNPANRPAGIVKFFAAGSQTGFSGEGSCNLPSSGANECSVTFTPQTAPGSGEISIEGKYEGDGVHKTSVGSFVLLVSGKHVTVTTIECESATIAVGHQVFCNFFVEDTGNGPAVPTGTLTLGGNGESSFPDGTTCNLSPVNTPAGQSKSKAVCSGRYLATGPIPPSRTISAQYPGDAAHVASTGNATIQVVAEHPTVATLTCVPKRIDAGGETHCTATVEDTLPAGQATAPTGEFTFLSDGPGSFTSEECNVTPLADGRSASCDVVYSAGAIGSGLHKLSASYRGDPIHAEAADDFGLEVGPNEVNDTQTTMSCEQPAILAGGSVFCTATVRDTGGPKAKASPTGSVAFTDPLAGAFTPASCQLQSIGSDIARCAEPVSFSTGVIGSHRLAADYAGDATHGESKGVLGLLVLAESHKTETKLSCEATQINGGDTVACTATVVDLAPASPIFPSGEVSFADADGGSFQPTSCELAQAGEDRTTCAAKVEFSPGSLGEHHITATFPGNEAHEASSGNLTVTVVKKMDPTGIALSCQPTSVKVGNSTECTASVEDVATLVNRPTGKVRFTSDNQNGAFEPDAECTLPPSGVNQCSVVYSPVQQQLTASGEDTLEAEYLGDEEHLTSVADFGVAVEPTPTPFDPTVTDLTCRPAAVVVNNAAVCEVELTDTADPSDLPHGRVHLESDNPQSEFIFEPNCTLEEGRATCSVIYFPRGVPASGEDTIEAVYLGEASHRSSSEEAKVAIQAEAPPMDETSVSVACDPASVIVGNATQCTATVTDTDHIENRAGGFVHFAPEDPSLGLPTGPTCTLPAVGPNQCSVLVLAKDLPVSGEEAGLEAQYLGDASHHASGLVFAVLVRAPGDPTDDTATTVQCTPASVLAGNLTECSAEVADPSGAAGRPSGSVHFASDSAQSSFPNGASCALPAAGAIRCTVSYRPQAIPQSGKDTIEAEYIGDGSHHRSTGTFVLTVQQSTPTTDPTTTTLLCAPASVEVGHASHCTATVTDTATMPLSPPSGEVHFGSDAAGSFSATDCTLSPGTGAQRECSVDYTPAPGSAGPHHIAAHYKGDAQHQASDAQAFTVTATAAAPSADPTTTTLLCAPASVEVGHASHCTATVTDTATTPLSPPSGEVHFGSDAAGSFSATDCTLSPGTGAQRECSVDYTPAPGSAGPHHIAAHYKGDAQHQASDAQAFTVTATAAAPTTDPTTTTLLCAPASVEVGHASHCTATVTDTATTPLSPPSGEVHFASDAAGTFSASDCTLSPGFGAQRECSVDYTPAPGSAGPHHIAAHYKGDAQHQASDAQAFTVTATPATVVLDDTSTEIACTPNSVDVGQQTICTATVKDVAAAGATVPTGTVHFGSDNPQSSFDSDTCELGTGNGTDTASCSVQYTPEASSIFSDHDTLDAAYDADGAHNDSISGPFFLTVTADAPTPQPTETRVECNPVTVILGGGSACTATVEGTTPGGSAPSGQVAFTDGAGGVFANPCQLAPAGAAKAACQTVYVPATAGARSVKGSYPGDAGHDPSSDETGIQVAPANGGHAVDTSVNCEPASVILGGATVCTIAVRDTAAAPTTPSGLVVLASTGSGSFGSGGCTLLPDGGDRARCQVVYTPSAVGAGVHAITALYSGDAGHEAGSADAQLTVTAPSGGHETATVLACDPTSVVLGAGTECTATVTDTEGTTTPSGAVVFASDSPGSFDSGGCLLTGNGGTASCRVTYTPSAVGEAPHGLTAQYAGSASHEPSGAGAEVTVQAPAHATATAISCAPTPVLLGSATSTCTATITDTAGKASAPGGSVKFGSDGPGGFSAGGACTLAAAGPDRATCSVTYSPTAVGSGSHRLTAAYQGEATHLKSQADQAVEVIDAPNTTFAKRPLRPRRQTAKRIARFGFVSDHAGSTFECKLDRRAFRSCKSPFKARVRPGRHVFQVRAVSSRGVADPTPATYRWRVLGRGAHHKRSGKKHS